LEPKVIDLERHQDDRGYLYEVIHGSDKFMDKFGQVYVVGNPVRGIVRAYHKHKELWDYFHIIKGSAKFVIWHESQENTELDKVDKKVFVLSDRKPQLLIVPAGWYHGWQSLEDDTILVSTANREYNHSNPDEKRIDPYCLGADIWEVEYK